MLWPILLLVASLVCALFAVASAATWMGNAMMGRPYRLEVAAAWLFSFASIGTAFLAGLLTGSA